MKSAIEEYSQVVTDSICHKWANPQRYTMWDICNWLSGALMFCDGELSEELDMLRDVAFYRCQTHFEDRFTPNHQPLMESFRSAYR